LISRSIRHVYNTYCKLLDVEQTHADLAVAADTNSPPKFPNTYTYTIQIP
jgi:hypothetical protein